MSITWIKIHTSLRTGPGVFIKSTPQQLVITLMTHNFDDVWCLLMPRCEIRDKAWTTHCNFLSGFSKLFRGINTASYQTQFPYKTDWLAINGLILLSNLELPILLRRAQPISAAWKVPLEAQFHSGRQGKKERKRWAGRSPGKWSLFFSPNNEAIRQGDPVLSWAQELAFSSNDPILPGLDF